MFIIRAPKDRDHPFTQISNDIIRDNRLSLKSKSLMLFLISKPDSWCFNYPDILKCCSNGIKSIRSSIKQLVSFGYLFPHQSHRPNGDFDFLNYTVYETSVKLSSMKTDTPTLSPFGHTLKGHAVEGHAYNAHHINTNNKIILRKKITTTGKSSNISESPVVDSKFQKKKNETIKLLSSMKIMSHKKIFDKFDVDIVLRYSLWLKAKKFKMENPTGYLISALKGKWMIDDISTNGQSFSGYYYYRCKKCGITRGYISKVLYYENCRSCTLIEL